MRIIAFAETTPALLAGAKTVTRREWNHKYARTFTAGELLQAWDKNPRTRQGKRVATIRLTAAPVWQAARDVPPEDYAAEGFAYLDAHGLMLGPVAGTKRRSTPGEVWDSWITAPPEFGLWVVRFELVGVLP